MQLFGRFLTIGAIAILSAIDINNEARSQESERFSTAPELERLQYFVGTWRCQQPAAPANPSGVFTWTVKRDLNNFWYVGNGSEIQSPNDGKPIDSREFLGYNAVSQQLMRSVIVSDGNSYNLTASDWQENKLIWSGSIVRKGKLSPLREEIVRDSADKFTATYFIPDKSNRWQPVVTESCDRQD